MQITIHGIASSKKFKLNITPKDLELSLLSFLRKNSIPMASSCDGDGVCKKCVFNETLFGCQIKVKQWDLTKPISISYL